MSVNSRKESELTVDSSMETTDKVRIVANSASRTITLDDLMTSSDDLIGDLGYLKAADISTGIVNKQKITSTATNYALLSTDSVIFVDVTSGDITVSLISAADSSIWDSANSKGQVFTIKLDVANSTNKVIIDPNSTELIDGASTFELIGPNLLFATIIPDGTGWHVIGG